MQAKCGFMIDSLCSFCLYILLKLENLHLIRLLFKTLLYPIFTIHSPFVYISHQSIKCYSQKTSILMTRLTCQTQPKREFSSNSSNKTSTPTSASGQFSDKHKMEILHMQLDFLYRVAQYLPQPTLSVAQERKM